MKALANFVVEICLLILLNQTVRLQVGVVRYSIDLSELLKIYKTSRVYVYIMQYNYSKNKRLKC